MSSLVFMFSMYEICYSIFFPLPHKPLSYLPRFAWSFFFWLFLGSTGQKSNIKSSKWLWGRFLSSGCYFWPSVGVEGGREIKKRGREVRTNRGHKGKLVFFCGSFLDPCFFGFLFCFFSVILPYSCRKVTWNECLVCRKSALDFTYYGVDNWVAVCCLQLVSQSPHLAPTEKSRKSRNGLGLAP